MSRVPRQVQADSVLSPLLVLDETAGLCRRHYPLLVAITTVAHGPLLAAQVAGTAVWLGRLGRHLPAAEQGGLALPPALLAEGLGVALGGWLLSVALGALAAGALMVAVAGLRAGEPVTLRGAYAAARRRWGALIGVTLAIQIALGVTVGLLGAVAWALSVLALPAGGAGPLPLLIQAAPPVAAGLLFCLLMLAVPAAALAGRGAAAALGEGIRRAARAYARVVAAYLLVGLVAAIPALGAGAVGAMLTVGGTPPASAPGTWVHFALPALALLLVKPLPGAAIAAIYLRRAPAQEEDLTSAGNWSSSRAAR